MVDETQPIILHGRGKREVAWSIPKWSSYRSVLNAKDLRKEENELVEEAKREREYESSRREVHWRVRLQRRLWVMIRGLIYASASIREEGMRGLLVLFWGTWLKRQLNTFTLEDMASAALRAPAWS